MSSQSCGCDPDIDHVCDGCTIAALRARIAALEAAITYTINMDAPPDDSLIRLIDALTPTPPQRST